MEICYHAHIDREIESLIERIHPPRVCIDNDSCRDCTVVKVDSANRKGILLEMVQVLTDLDLIISKSYISSDGGWFMDVFHVTDEAGKKLTDETLMLHIQQELCVTRSKGKISRDREGGCEKGAEEEVVGKEITAMEMSGLENVVAAHRGERKRVRVTRLGAGHTQRERRLHQLMYADRDYESCRACDGDSSGAHKKGCDGTHVSVGKCEDKGYLVVNVRSRDRPKLLFDTVCVLTDMQYVVFHAAISSKRSMAHQEYYIRQMGSSGIPSESEKQKLTLCLIAAVERRVSHGLRMDIVTENRAGLLSNVTRVFRENGLSISRFEIGTEGGKAVGSFFVTDCSGEEVNPNIVELVRQETGGSVVIDHKSPHRLHQSSSSSSSVIHQTTDTEEGKPKFSLGSLLWSRLERLSGGFGPIRS
ncbi:hypothetical protein LR48_Vigan06g024000 [Vigna angularis]|uniref:ACT domain-containing protein ACR n=1 Tax=Phaseolus angularis TaxID=3914 RepID=A0A0L9UQW7_PHAAN|nr:hypothetical protein LR48_Vigan06g024000 [Vigna angularis]